MARVPIRLEQPPMNRYGEPDQVQPSFPFSSPKIAAGVTDGAVFIDVLMGEATKLSGTGEIIYRLSAQRIDSAQPGTITSDGSLSHKELDTYILT